MASSSILPIQMECQFSLTFRAKKSPYPLFNIFLIFLSMKNIDKDVSTSTNPISKKKDDCLNPSSLSSLYWITVVVAKGTKHSARLEMISMIPITDPSNFRWTTMGIAATITLA
jgi:hypothetical protein